MDWPTFDDEAPAAATGEKRDLPEGQHVLQIKEVEETPELLKLKLAHADKSYWWAKCRLPKSARWAGEIIGKLAGALAMSPADWKASAAGDLVGRWVTAEITHRQRDDGGVWVNVTGFSPAPATAGQPDWRDEVPAKPPAKRTPHQKAKAAAAEAGDGDDIPF